MRQADKKHGRRKAGSWGRAAKKLKRVANKATRKLSKRESRHESNG
jgi:hypothetical protein